MSNRALGFFRAITGLRALLIGIALIGCGVATWTDAVSRAWIYHLLRCDQEAWVTAIRVPRSAARDRVLVRALTITMENGSATLQERRAALATLSCLAPDASPALPALGRMLDMPALPLPLSEVLKVVSELARSDPAARGLLNAAFLRLSTAVPGSPERLEAVTQAIADSGAPFDGLVRQLGELAADSRQGEGTRGNSLRALANLGEMAEQALPELSTILDDAEYLANLSRRLRLVQVYEAIGIAARGSAPSFVERFKQQTTHTDAVLVRLFATLSSPDEAMPLLGSVIGTSDSPLWVRCSAAAAVLAMNSGAPEPILLARQILSSYGRPAPSRGEESLVEFMGFCSQDFLLECAPPVAERLVLLLPDANPEGQEYLLHLLAALGKEACTARQLMVAALPRTAGHRRAQLLVLICSLAPPESHLIESFHEELSCSSNHKSATLAVQWLLRVGPDELALDCLEEWSRHPPVNWEEAFGVDPFLLDAYGLLEMREVRPAFLARDTDAFTALAVGWLAADEESLQMAGAVALGIAVPQHADLMAWLQRRISSPSGKHVGLQFAEWLGPSAQSLSPLLFRMLMDDPTDRSLAALLRSIEGRAGCASTD